MSYSCHSIGINGGCGTECPVFLDGDCQNVDEDSITEIYESFEFDDDLRTEVLEMYGFDSESVLISINLDKLKL